MSQFTEVSITVEADGKNCAVAIPREKYDLVMRLVATAFDNGIPLIRLDDRYSFEKIQPHKDQAIPKAS